MASHGTGAARITRFIIATTTPVAVEAGSRQRVSDVRKVPYRNFSIRQSSAALDVEAGRGDRRHRDFEIWAQRIPRSKAQKTSLLTPKNKIKGRLEVRDYKCVNRSVTIVKLTSQPLWSVREAFAWLTHGEPVASRPNCFERNLGLMSETEDEKGRSGANARAQHEEVHRREAADAHDASLVGRTGPLNEAALLGRKTPPWPDSAAANVGRDSASPAEAVRALAGLLLGYALLLAGNGLFQTLIPLRMIQSDYSTLVVGLIQSCYYAGYILGAVINRRLIDRIGQHRTFVAFSAAASILALAFGGAHSPWTLGFIRLLTGVAFMGLYTRSRVGSMVLSRTISVDRFSVFMRLSATLRLGAVSSCSTWVSILLRSSSRSRLRYLLRR